MNILIVNEYILTMNIFICVALERVVAVPQPSIIPQQQGEVTLSFSTFQPSVLKHIQARYKTLTTR